MTTLENIDKLIEVYENPEKYFRETAGGLCFAYKVVFNSYDLYDHIDPIWSPLLKLARARPDFLYDGYWFPSGAIAPRLEILKQYRKQLTDGRLHKETV